jgi:hypothetical protein
VANQRLADLAKRCIIMKEDVKMKKLFLLLVPAILLLAITGCAPGKDIEVNVPASTIQLSTPGPNPELNKAGPNGVAGIAQGLWHGLIAPVTLVLSFFNESIQMYEVHNSGKEYNLGFLIGVAVVFLILGITGGRWR